jgi:hypothetical protein
MIVVVDIDVVIPVDEVVPETVAEDQERSGKADEHRQKPDTV